jgi:type IV pilus assembly protein PilM
LASRLPSRTAAMGPTCVAIDLGTTTVRVVEVEWGKGGDGLAGARVTRRGSAPLPNGVWNDLEMHRDAISNAIKQALSAAGITSHRVVACLPRRLVTVRYLRLPPAPPEQMAGMVAFEAQQYVLFPLEEVILDHQVMTASGGKGPLDQDDLETVLLAAARRSVVAYLMSIFDHAGLELVQLSVSALALAELARNSLEATALIDVEPGEIDVAVVADGQLLFTRASAVDTTANDEATAQRRKVEEVFRSFTAYQNEFRSIQLAHVYFGGADMAGDSTVDLERALSEIIDVPVKPYSGPLVPASEPALRAYLTAIGTAMQTRDGAIAAVNLVPHERAEQRAQQTKSRQQKLMVVAAAVVGLVAFTSAQGILKRRAEEMKLQDAANMRLDEINDKVSKKQKTYDTQSGLYKDLVQNLDRTHPSVDVLVALNATLPHSANLWITQFSFERGKMLTLRGNAKSASAPVEFVLAMQRSHAFRDVLLSYLGDASDSEDDGSQSADSAPTNTPPTAATPLPGLATANRTPAATTPVPGAGQPLALNGRQNTLPGGPGVPNFQGGPGGPGGFGGPGGVPGNPGAGGPNFQGGPGGPGGPNFQGGRNFQGGPGGFGGPGGAPGNPGAGGPGGPNFAGNGPRGPQNPGGPGNPGGAAVTVAPVPSFSTPPGGLQITPGATTSPGGRPATATPATTVATVPATARKTATRPAKQALTSFIITCRVNVKARTLLPVNARAVSDGGTVASNASKTPVKTAKADANTGDADSGGENASTH